ncbi:ATP-binding cassette domain-containing protein [Ancylobacter rudongensis]|uniref:Ribose transport system ATP-binding protein n=1 Tax=Ancylobacter rudongensis TaxID=177413 RepID=A0A1G4RE43_9HYPH|nr:ATP-binding cassette domain-containing protein [Ancylobacter rudongensis]SCW55213.1 ribose transport system ATP-binding protein [Ancylobacter rudongensis]
MMTAAFSAAQDAPAIRAGVSAPLRPSHVAAGTDAAAPVVRLSGICKAFGPTRANDGIDLMVAPGEVLGLVGGNGAGKSTLMRILCGVTRADAGRIALRGIDIAPDLYDTGLAQAGGIRIVHQELSLCDNLSVAENFFLEAPEAARALPGWRRAFRARARAALDEVFPDHGISVDARVAHLAIGQRQMVEIARAVATPQVRLVILDEPTSSLGLERSRQLRAFIKARTREGLAFIFISHKLQEVVDIAHRVLVLRNGRSVWSGPAVEASVEALVQAMGGPAEGVMLSRRAARPAIGERARERVRLTGALIAPLGRDVVLRAGEVVGLAGLEGSGQRDLLHGLHGRPGPGISREGKASFVSGDRQKEGVFPLWSVLSNIALGRLEGRAPLGRVDNGQERDAARVAAEKLKLDPARFDSPILDLSGGNQQKALVARALVGEADTILFDDPTRGVDVAAKEDFYALIGSVAQAGRLVIWHSTEDIEFLECDRVLVFAGGRIVRELVGTEITEQAIVDASFAGTGALERDATAGARGPLDRLVDLAPFASLAAVFALMAWVNPLTVSMFGLELLLGPAIALVLVALAQMFVVGGSEIDLGVGAFAGLVNVLSATLLFDTPWLGGVALIASVLAYGLIGATIQLRRIPAIVVTLGASFIWLGLGYTLQPTPGGASPEWLSAAFAWTLADVPATLILIAVAAVIALAIDRSPLGVVLRGFGNNAQAMTLGGWSPLRYAILRYMLASLFALAAGLSLTAINTASDINAGGPFTLISVAAVVMGGCALIGGMISPLGVVAGALTLALVGALLGALGVSTDYNAAVQGCLLLSMLALRAVADRREARR